MINALSKQVIFLGDFNSKHKQFWCVKPNKSGQTLLNIAKDLKLFYVNQLEPNRHTREDPAHGTSDILDMAFITPGLSSRDISFSVADDHMGSDHFPIQISLDEPLKRNTPLTEPRYRFDKTKDDLLHNTLKDSLSNIDTNITTQDELEELAVTLCDKLMKAVDTSAPKVYSRSDPKSPISQAILDLIKEKRRLRRLYNNTQDPNTKSTINKLQKEIRTKINQESTISWEKFCNSISLESDPKKSWRKITNFLKPKGPRSYPTLKLGNKTAKTNPEKAQLFAESVERNFGIESHLFSKSQFDRVNKFVEAHSYHFTPLNSLYDSITDTDDDSDLVADVDPDTLIRVVWTDLKNGKAPGIDNVYNIILKKAIGTGFYKVLARAFTISLKLGFIPHVWKIAVLCMLIKPDKPPSQTTSYRPISLLSAIMKLFERVIEKRLRKHLEDNGFFSKYQSGFRKSKSTNDHLFRLSQTIMESFNRGEHVIVAFLDVEKAFDNVWHNGLRYKIYQLDLPTKLCRWLSDFLVGRVIQVKIEGFLSPKVYPKAGVPQGSNLSPLLFLIYVNDMPNPSHHQTDKSQFADDAGQWAVSKNIDLAAEYLQRDLDKLARWCAKWRIKLNPEKTKLIIFSKSRFAIRAEPALSLYSDLLSYYPQIKFLGITFDNRMTFTKHFEEILERCNQKFHRLRILVNKKWGPSPETILQIYKQCVRPIFEYGIVSTITVSETVITKIQRVQNSFIRLALRLPKYVSARLLHEASGLPYVKERLTSVGQNHLARMHSNPLVEHTINSAKTNIAWDKYKTPISILKPPDWSTDTDYKMQENEVTSANVQPLPWKW